MIRLVAIAAGVAVSVGTGLAQSQGPVTGYEMIIHTKDHARQSIICAKIDSITFARLPAEGLVAYYPFWDKRIDSGVRDESGQQNHGAFGPGQAPTYVSGRFGLWYHGYEAMRFTSDADYFLIPNIIDSMSEMTFAAWVYVDTVVGWNWILGDLRTPTSICQVGVGVHAVEQDSAKITYHFTSHDGTNHLHRSDGSRKIGYEKWIHVATVYDGDSLKGYINTERDYAWPHTGVVKSDLDSLTVGIGYSSSEYFRGDIDDIRIYDRALTTSELDTLFHEGGFVVR